MTWELVLLHSLFPDQIGIYVSVGVFCGVEAYTCMHSSMISRAVLTGLCMYTGSTMSGCL